MSSGATRYCIDSSSLIHCRYTYPIEVFQGVWDGLDALIGDGRLIAHEEVWLEINRGNDELTQWAAQWKAELAVGHDGLQVAIVQQIAVDFPLTTYSTTTEHRADPWVVALAQTRSCCVISEEVGASERFPKIPQMCLKYGVPHLKILDVMRSERWSF